ncbi:MAG: M14 metallopeptidase family protein [Ferruginibacter sp.]
MTVKKIAGVFLLLCFSVARAQTLPSPEVFLGYTLGTKYTAHHRIVSYFENAATLSPRNMKLEKYGATYEGRPLMIAVISSPENMLKIEEIRKNNLRLTGLLTDKPGDKNAPAIVWLSYNVHGNETSSSEVSMKMLYELISGKNASLTGWLNNTVVIIDPCLNPDGRERYVNWFTQISGKFPNADPASREHMEPWPNGRSNHYLFDLNRDWAWQSQKESTDRLKVYQQWMPQIHCDFHEQDPGSPYYFAPAAEPVHEAVTQWQKDFQVSVGKNHARYFDAKGWLYFTKQYFDLFYPSYGDTYPLFNGSIGMTYEQAGSGEGGVSVAVGSGDTLTLSERIEHHYTTSMSTVEVASVNAGKLVSAFKTYFDDANAGSTNGYKNYIVSNKAPNTLNALLELLKKNNIRFGFAPSGRSLSAYNYFSGKTENININKNDLVIPAAQPKAALLRVLFEPQSRLSDSATYDITAWALPFVYGLQSFATKETVISAEMNSVVPVKQIPADAYGYIIPMNGFNDTKLLSELLKEGIKTRFSETPFSFNDIKYAAGSLIVLRKGNEEKMNRFLMLAGSTGNSADPISSGFMQSGFDLGSDRLHILKNPSVALLTGPGVSSTASGEVWHLFEQQLNRPITLLNVADVANTDLKNYNVLIAPAGNYPFLQSKESATDIKRWITGGGRLIVMESAVKQVAALDWGLKLKKPAEEKTDTSRPYADVKNYADREKESVTNNIPGAIYKMQLDSTHPIGFGYPGYYYTLKRNENVYEFIKDGWNTGIIKNREQVAGFVGSRVKDNIRDAVLIGEIPMGRGSVIFFADDPIFRSFWETGKMMFCNAVFFTGQ